MMNEAGRNPENLTDLKLDHLSGLSIWAGMDLYFSIDIPIYISIYLYIYIDLLFVAVLIPSSVPRHLGTHGLRDLGLVLGF